MAAPCGRAPLPEDSPATRGGSRNADGGLRRPTARAALAAAARPAKRPPSLRIPAACSGLAQTTASARCFDNQRVGAASVLQPHPAATGERLRHEAIVLIPQATTQSARANRGEKM